MVMIFIFFFGLTFNASPYAYAAEVLPTKIRANGMSIGLFVANGLTVMFSQTAPLALEAITWRFSFIFVGCNLFFFPIVYFFFPEVCLYPVLPLIYIAITKIFQTKGLTLEEVNGVFGDKIAMEMNEISVTSAEKENITVKHVDYGV